MRNLLYTILLISPLLFIACSPDNGDKAIDFSNTLSLQEDDRVHALHKSTYPVLCEEYVLWRVKHDGSCWNSVGLTLLLYHMIEGGGDTFDRALEHFRAIFRNTDPMILQRKSVKDFFAVLGQIRQRMDHRYSLELRSQGDNYLILDTGLRMLLANIERQKANPNLEKADEFETPFSWQNMKDIKPLLHQLSFKYAGIACYCEGSLSVQLDEYLSQADINLLRGDTPEARRIIQDKLPVMMAFGTSPAFADIIVKKSFAEQIRNAGQRISR